MADPPIAGARANRPGETSRLGSTIAGAGHDLAEGLQCSFSHGFSEWNPILAFMAILAMLAFPLTFVRGKQWKISKAPGGPALETRARIVRAAGSEIALPLQVTPRLTSTAAT